MLRKIQVHSEIVGYSDSSSKPHRQIRKTEHRDGQPANKRLPIVVLTDVLARDFSGALTLLTGGLIVR